MTPTTLKPVETLPEHETRLHERILTREARIGVVGLGYVGLPLALEFARAGFSVTGLDSDERKVDRVNTRRSYIEDVDDSELEAVVDTLSATANPAALGDVDVVDICVPTPLRKTRDPDLSFVVQAVESVARHLRAGQLIILESTTYPGSTEEVVLPILEATGLKAGVDFFVAFSPERIDPGNASYSTGTIPKVVGGIDDADGLERRRIWRDRIPHAERPQEVDRARQQRGRARIAGPRSRLHGRGTDERDIGPDMSQRERGGETGRAGPDHGYVPAPDRARALGFTHGVYQSSKES